MRRLLGIVLILHGLAHAGAGMWSVGASWSEVIVFPSDELDSGVRVKGRPGE